LLVDPGVRFGRLDAARQGNLVREELACFQEEIPLARRELRFRGQRPLAMRAVTDDLCELAPSQGSMLFGPSWAAA